jgi:GPH family glycoside/pentoside/hexuronide:cation symporter
MAIYFLIPNKLVVYTFIMFSGFGYAGFVIVTSLLADVLDVDELETGEKRAGAFLGFWSVIVKAAQSVGPVIVGWALAVAGYVPNAPQTPLVVYTMRLLYGPIPALFFIVSYLLFRHFSLTRERLSEVQAELARRRATSII